MLLRVSNPQALIRTKRAFPFEIVYVNDAWEQLCQFSADDVLGSTCACLQGPATDKVAIAKAVSIACITGESSVTVYNYRKGCPYPFLNHIELFQDPTSKDVMLAKLVEVPGTFSGTLVARRAGISGGCSIDDLADPVFECTW